MKQVATVIVQTSSMCNLDCGYCYMRASRHSHGLDAHTVLRDIDKVIQNCAFGFDKIKFDWHGGEPLMMGIDYYKNVVRVQRTLANRYGIEFSNTIQTNGTLLGDEYLDFLLENEFKIGLSYDGVPGVTEETRLNHSGIGALDFIYEISDRFRVRRFPLSILCVVSKQNVALGEDIFKFLSAVGVNSYALLPIMEFPREECPKAPSNEEIGDLYKKTFELWASPANPFKTIEPITTIVQSLLSGRTPTLCSFASSCLKRMATITPEGNVIQCGSLCAEEFIMGKIYDSTLKEILASRKARTLREMRTHATTAHCNDCEYINICRGGCRASAYWISGEYGGRYPYCEARKDTFRYIKNRLEEICGTAIVGAGSVPVGNHPLSANMRETSTPPGSLM